MTKKEKTKIKTPKVEEEIITTEEQLSQEIENIEVEEEQLEVEEKLETKQEDSNLSTREQNFLNAQNVSGWRKKKLLKKQSEGKTYF